MKRILQRKVYLILVILIFPSFLFSQGLSQEEKEEIKTEIKKNREIRDDQRLDEKIDRAYNTMLFFSDTYYKSSRAREMEQYKGYDLSVFNIYSDHDDLASKYGLKVLKSSSFPFIELPEEEGLFDPYVKCTVCGHYYGNHNFQEGEDLKFYFLKTDDPSYEKIEVFNEPVGTSREQWWRWNIKFKSDEKIPSSSHAGRDDEWYINYYYNQVKSIEEKYKNKKMPKKKANSLKYYRERLMGLGYTVDEQLALKPLKVKEEQNKPEENTDEDGVEYYEIRVLWPDPSDEIQSIVVDEIRGTEQIVYPTKRWLLLENGFMKDGKRHGPVFFYAFTGDYGDKQKVIRNYGDTARLRNAYEGGGRSWKSLGLAGIIPKGVFTFENGILNGPFFKITEMQLGEKIKDDYQCCEFDSTPAVKIKDCGTGRSDLKYKRPRLGVLNIAEKDLSPNDVDYTGYSSAFFENNKLDWYIDIYIGWCRSYERSDNNVWDRLKGTPENSYWLPVEVKTGVYKYAKLEGTVTTHWKNHIISEENYSDGMKHGTSSFYFAKEGCSLNCRNSILPYTAYEKLLDSNGKSMEPKVMHYKNGMVYIPGYEEEEEVPSFD